MSRIRVLLFLTTVLFACNAPAFAQSGLAQLLKQGDYFRLDAQFKQQKQRLTPEQQLYFQAHISNAFNQNESCIKEVNELLDHHASQLSDSVKAVLYGLLEDSYFKLFDYAQAARCASTAINSYSQYIDSSKLADKQTMLGIYTALKNYPRQQTLVRHNTTINWVRNKIGIIEIPVRRNGRTDLAIFDTRANLSTISESYAAKLGLRILPASHTSSSGITGIQFHAGLAVADSLYIGDILVRNTVFQVLADSFLYIPQVDFRMNIIIGFPIIAQLKEVHLFKDGRLMVPAKPSTNSFRNLALDGLDPVIPVRKGTDTLCFLLDLGAGTSVFYEAYYKKFKADIPKDAKETSRSYGGAGGVLERSVYALPSTDLYFGSKKITLSGIDVLTKKISADERYYGNLGQDFIQSSSELVLNFSGMFIRL